MLTNNYGPEIIENVRYVPLSVRSNRTPAL